MYRKSIPSGVNTLCESDSDYLQRLPNAEQHFLEVGEWHIHVVTAGSGPKVMLVHGLGSSWRWWEPTINRLISSHSVVAIDLPGSGNSSPLTTSPTSKQYSELIQATLESFGPALIVGHSLGGFAGLQAAYKGVGGIKGLFLYAPAGFGKVENKYFRALSVPGLGSVLSRTGDYGIDLLLKSLVHSDAPIPQMRCWTDDSRDAKKQFLYQLQIGIDWSGQTNRELVLKEIDPLSISVQLVWGRFDSVFSINTGYHAAHLLGLSGPRIAEQSGHFVHLEEPDWFVSELMQFMQEQS